MEKSFYDWNKIKSEFCESSKSGRRLAKEFGLSEGAIRKRAKAEGWLKLGDIPSRLSPVRRSLECVPDNDLLPPRSTGPQDEVAGASTTDLTKRGRNLILDLMTELEFLNRNAAVLSDLVEDHFNGEKDGATRQKLLRALDHETRAKTANNLATALAKLNDAGPGKKQMAEDEAKTAGQNSEWAGDLEFAGARPN